MDAQNYSIEILGIVSTRQAMAKDRLLETYLNAVCWGYGPRVLLIPTKATRAKVCEFKMKI